MGLWVMDRANLKEVCRFKLHPSMRQTGGRGLTVTNWYTPHTQTCSRERNTSLLNVLFTLTTEQNGTFGGRGNVSLAWYL